MSPRKKRELEFDLSKKETEEGRIAKIPIVRSVMARLGEVLFSCEAVSIRTRFN